MLQAIQVIYIISPLSIGLQSLINSIRELAHAYASNYLISRKK